jgi:hypothetical protein
MDCKLQLLGNLDCSLAITRDQISAMLGGSSGRLPKKLPSKAERAGIPSI